MQNEENNFSQLLFRAKHGEQFSGGLTISCRGWGGWVDESELAGKDGDDGAELASIEGLPCYFLQRVRMGNALDN